ncbi:diguanylate cyclase domain-containing protein [Streptomyces sp. cf386]|uniref:sensor domain-containing diguanylate cyclase n=1 Tax=Streptomyces sp. cf386 TaxID=1761904 RepID=UPI000D1A64BA
MSVKVLLVAANPLDTGRLALDEEMRLVQERTEQSPYAAEIEFVPVWAARADDLLREINRHAPTVLHFSGHSSLNSIDLVGTDRRAQPVSREAVLRLLGLDAARSVRVVLLNSCYSAEMAKDIAHTGRCAIGTIEQWGDEQAALFSASFYRALGFGATLKEAVEQGCTSILLEGYTGADDIRLHGDEVDEDGTEGAGGADGADGSAMRLVGPAAHDAGRRAARAQSSGIRDGQPAEPIPLFNESECADFVTKSLAGARSAALTYLDVDGLLGINDVYGEHVGDLVIQRCSELVAVHSAESAALCRLRGDQYVVVERDVDVSSAEKRAGKLVTGIRRHKWSYISRDLHVSATGSIAHWHGVDEDAPSLILRAVLGVKEAKIRHRASLAAAPLALPELGGEFERERDKLWQLSSYLSSDTRRSIKAATEARLEQRRARPRF